MPLKKAPISTESHASKLILFGEDDMDDKEVLVEAFSAIDKSYYLEFVNNGQKIISNLEKMVDGKLPCLIVLDYNLPELNGAEVLRELKQYKRYDSIPKIIWSTSGSDTYKSICMAMGARAYLIKPSNVKDLEDTVRLMISLC